ncbi:MAG: Fic family protein [Candidatus Pacebacteria bacterium]|nr:Fic family protein [Candidatus Paceibacterota bacterium]
MLFKLEKPDLSKMRGNRIVELMENKELQQIARKTMSPDYLYWDKIKYRFKQTLPKGVSTEELWALTKFIRKYFSEQTITPIKNEKGEKFSFIKLSRFEQFLHETDLNMRGSLFVNSGDDKEKRKYQFISRGIMEEAIASSQLEGANTTRKAAKEFLREGRTPRTKDEKMILNSYHARKAIEEKYKKEKLDLQTIFELHRILTIDTVKDEEIGRFRTDKDDIVVANNIENIVYHVPPKEIFVKKEIKELIKFANDETETQFIHPVTKAILIHFWLGYLHPFTDGNGRLARALFYWYLSKKDYWAFNYLPISKNIKNSQTQYGMAYVLAEQDDCDLTYFIDYNIDKIQLAIKDFEAYVEKKRKENIEISKISKSKYNFNDRQLQLLQYLNGNRYGKTSVSVYMNINNLRSRITASTDLKKLKEQGFLYAKKKGKEVFYFATKKIDELFE